MNKISFVLTLFLMFTQFFANESVFVEIGKYPGDALYSQVNQWNCGFNKLASFVELAETKNLTLDRTCLCFEKYKEVKRATNRKIPSNRVFNGSNAVIGEAPWVVHLDVRILSTVLQNFQIQGCTGVLITMEWVLTAAHCFVGLIPFDVRIWYATFINVYAGSNQRYRGEARTSWKPKWFPHPNFLKVETDKMNEWDIALIKLSEKFVHSTDEGRVGYRINPICLPDTRQRSWDREKAVFHGYGRIGMTSEQVLAFLQRGEAYVRNCGDKPTKLCASVLYGPRPCGGDSGGPLIQYVEENRAVLLGILQGNKAEGGTTDCSDKIFLSEWVAVHKFIDWILETIANN